MTIAFGITIALLVGLFLFFTNEVRRSPGPMEWGKTPKWKRRIRLILTAIPLIGISCVFWGTFIEPNRLVVHHVSIDNTGLPQGMKIAVLSDIHAGGWFVREKKLREIVEKTNQ